MSTHGEDLQAAEEIRNLVGRYCDVIARLDLDAVGACWAEDGVWTVFDEDVEGRAAIVERFGDLVSRVAWVVQHASSPLLEIHGDRATGVWQVVEFGRHHPRPETDGPGGLIQVGRYVDAYVRAADGWAFARRRFETLHASGLAFA